MLTAVTLRDYGTYKGKHVFKLRANPDKPVILIGGHNGSGKTTFFESIMVGLYGQLYIGRNSAKYEKFLGEKINVEKKSTSERTFSVEIEFELVNAGDVENYTIKREWTISNDDYAEDLTILKNGRRLNEIEESQWQAFIEEIIPMNISKLFFFDGEKIVNIAIGEGNDYDVQSSFRTLLGLDVIEQLHEDLRVFMMRNTKDEARGIKAQHRKCILELQDAEKSMEKLEIRRAEKKEKQQNVEKTIAECEQKISHIGGGFAKKRYTFLEKSATIKAQNSAYADEIRMLLGKTMPLCLIPEHITNVKKQIESDCKVVQKNLEKTIILEKRRKIAELLDDRFWNSRKVNQKLKSAVMKNIETALKTNYTNKNPMIDMSRLEAEYILLTINELYNADYRKLKELTTKISKTSDELKNIEVFLNSTPNEDELVPITKKINDYNYENGILENEIEHLNGQLLAKRTLIKMLNSKMKNMLDDMYDNEDTHTRVKLALKVRDVLEKYVEKLRAEKIRVFEEHIKTSIESIMHKKSLIKRITIDPDTFQMILYDNNGRKISNNKFAMGERQMLAISIMIALSKMSGKTLPFIIDTPLARLDSEHRELLVKRFFNKASHQIIILSTDTEFDQSYYEKVLPSISRTYTLKYVQGTMHTSSQMKYFWENSK